MASSAYPTLDRNFQLVIAIDLGTTYSGYAFSFKGKEKDIFSYTGWGKDVGIPVSFKAPTCILTYGDGEFAAFGYEAQKRFSERAPNDIEEYHLFQKFKMHLHSKGVGRKGVLTANSGQIRPAMDIFAMVLKYLKDHALDELEKQTGRKPRAEDIKWVVTVPAIWSAASKQFMREAACKGGLINDVTSKKLVIALEPECASVYCRDVQTQLAPLSASQKGSRLTEGTKYVVLDCGGGTLDVTVHKTLPSGQLAERHTATGLSLGGTLVDDQFLKLLEEIYGQEVMKTFKDEYPAGMLSLCVNIERAKHSINPGTKAAVCLPVSGEFAECYREVMGRSIKEAISKEHAESGITCTSGMLKLPYDVVIQVYDTVVTKIVDHIRTLVQGDQVSNATHLLLVGGLGESNVIHNAIRQNFGKRYEILVPAEASRCVLKGAVLYGHSPEIVSSRCARKTYGCKVYPMFDPRIHDPERKEVVDGLCRAKNVFKVMVRKGQSIAYGETFTETLEAVSESQTYLSIPIYQTDALNPRYVDEVGSVRMGKVMVKLPGTGRDRTVHVHFRFCGTEIEVEAKDRRPGGDVASTTVDFLAD